MREPSSASVQLSLVMSLLGNGAYWGKCFSQENPWPWPIVRTRREKKPRRVTRVADPDSRSPAARARQYAKIARKTRRLGGCAKSSDTMLVSW
jgi:hypothetical protein